MTYKQLNTAFFHLLMQCVIMVSSVVFIGCMYDQHTQCFQYAVGAPVINLWFLVTAVGKMVNGFKKCLWTFLCCKILQELVLSHSKCFCVRVESSFWNHSQSGVKGQIRSCLAQPYFLQSLVWLPRAKQGSDWKRRLHSEALSCLTSSHSHTGVRYNDTIVSRWLWWRGGAL